jgi:MFS family permease
MSTATRPQATAVPRARESLYLVCGLIALTQAAWGLVIPVLPVYAKEFGASAFELGIVVSSFSIARLCVNIPAGVLSDKLNRKHVMLGAVAGVGVVLLLTAAVNSLALLIVTRVLLGLAGGTAITVGQSLLADITDGGARGRAMASLQAFQLAGSSVGPALGGIIAGFYGPRASYLVAGAVAIVMCLIALIRMPNVKRAITENVGPQPKAWAMFRDRSFIAACGVAFSVFLTRYGGMQTLVALIAYSSGVGLTSSAFGITIGVLAIINIGMVPIIGRLSEKSRKAPIFFSMLMTAGGYAAMSAVHSPGFFFIAIAVLGLANGLSASVPAAYCADVIPARLRGNGIGIYRTFGDFGGLVGPIIVGALVDGWGTGAASLVTASICVVVALSFGAVAQETVGRRANHRLIA